MAKKKIVFVIKERYNPQLGTYYTKVGEATLQEYKDMVKGASEISYGSVSYMKYDTVEEYESACKNYNVR